MFLLQIEVERRREDQIVREQKQMVFKDRAEAEARLEYFDELITCRFTHFLKNGETLSVRKCTLMHTNGADERIR